MCGPLLKSPETSPVESPSPDVQSTDVQSTETQPPTSCHTNPPDGEGVLVSVYSRDSVPLLSFRMSETLLRKRSQFCRAALDWPTDANVGKSSVSIIVDPPSLAPCVKIALGLDGDVASSSLLARRPNDHCDDAVDPPPLDVVALKVLCEQLGLNSVESHVDAFLEKDLSPQTAMVYLVRAAELQPTESSRRVLPLPRGRLQRGCVERRLSFALQKGMVPPTVVIR